MRERESEIHSRCDVAKIWLQRKIQNNFLYLTWNFHWKIMICLGYFSEKVTIKHYWKKKKTSAPRNFKFVWTRWIAAPGCIHFFNRWSHEIQSRVYNLKQFLSPDLINTRQQGQIFLYNFWNSHKIFIKFYVFSIFFIYARVIKI